MALPKVALILISLAVLAHGANIPKPRPGQYSPGGAAAGGPSMGVVVPNMFGWSGGWSSTEPPTVGWTTPPPTEAPTTIGWTAPPTTGWPAAAGSLEEVYVEMGGEAAVLGAGEAGATHGFEISVSSDDYYNPGSASFSSGSYASLGQGAGILQISNIGSDGSSNSFQGVDSYNFGDAGEYSGGNLAGTQIDAVGGGGSYVAGEGWIEQAGYTLNDQILAKKQE